MALAHTYLFTKTVVEWEKIQAAMGSDFKVVTSRPFRDKKGKLPDGTTMTLQVIKDDMDYGVDKNGVQRENNLFQNFDVTVLSPVTVKKGDMVRLENFDSEHSFAIGYDLLLRFKSCRVLPTGANKDA